MGETVRPPTQSDLVTVQAEHQAALAELKRSRADYENRRRALEAERQLLAAWTTAGVARELARMEGPLADATTPADADTLYRHLLDLLTRHGLEAIPAEGTYDPSTQQAMMQAPGPAGEVILEMRRGYRNAGRVVRLALVAVGSGESR